MLPRNFKDLLIANNSSIPNFDIYQMRQTGLAKRGPINFSETCTRNRENTKQFNENKTQNRRGKASKE